MDSISRRPRVCGACAVSRRRAEDGGGVWEEALLRGREGDGSRSRGELGWRGGPGTKGGRTLKRQERWQRDGGRGEGSSDVWYSSFFPCSGLSRGSLVPLGQGSNVAPKARPSRGLGSASAHPLLILCSFLTSNSCIGLSVPQTRHAPSGRRIFAHTVPSARYILLPILPG